MIQPNCFVLFYPNIITIIANQLISIAFLSPFNTKNTHQHIVSFKEAIIQVVKRRARGINYFKLSYLIYCHFNW